MLLGISRQAFKSEGNAAPRQVVPLSEGRIEDDDEDEDEDD